FAFLTDEHGNIIYHPDNSLIMKTSIDKSNVFAKSLKDNYKALWEGQLPYIEFSGINSIGERGTYLVFSKEIEETGWKTFLVVEKNEILKEATKIIRLQIIMNLIFIMITAAALFLSLTRGLSGLSDIKDSMIDISEGKLYTEIDIKRKDEIGILSDTLKKMREKLKFVVSNVYGTSVELSNGSTQLAQNAAQLSMGASDQSANAEEVSSSIEEMSANIQQNTDNASHTEKISSQAAKAAEEGGMAVIEAVKAMNEIAEKINIVGDIARQTNMLSLNAAIEAARAGEHGKGFAVVASEVGKLAAVSQKAAGEILELANESVDKANAAGSKIQAIVPDIQKTAELVTEISASSNEQNTGAVQINKAMIQLDTIIQNNASSAEDASSLSEELTKHSEELRDMISFFKLNKDDKHSYQSSILEHKNSEIPVKKEIQKRFQHKIDIPVLSSVDSNSYDYLDSDFMEF
ncbi:MAG: methyl-accepting chemotaxis protein, partial [Spirochaetales bacterium]|nr:methyl-accepting chemotaxis protein [Spirochaetales bacterium]